jgi:ketosteroid isomerase-like protein
MTSSDTSAHVKTLTDMNAHFLRSAQNGDVKWYSEHLADDFRATLPDLKFRNKSEFLEMMAQPRGITGLTAHDVVIRVLGDFAIVHARHTYRTDDGVMREGRYTDDYQLRSGKWVCVAANVIARGI